MAETTLTPAQRRKQKILDRGAERMSKVLGTYGQDAGIAVICHVCLLGRLFCRNTTPLNECRYRELYILSSPACGETR